LHSDDRAPAPPDRRRLAGAEGALSSRVTVDGKQFAVGGARFDFRGVTYGTFAPRADGHQFPERDRIKRDFAAMCEAGFTVVRTYTAPPDDLVELAGDWGLRILAGVFYPDWRYSVGASIRQARGVARAARTIVRAEARRLAGAEQILGLVLGNEIPADVVRWLGTARVARYIRGLEAVVRSEDDAQLVTYANFPTTEFLSLPTLDFSTFNVYLPDRADLRRYITRLHHLAGERPLVLGEIGLHVPPGPKGERAQARFVSEQLDTALERGVAGTCLFSWTDDWWVGGAPVEGWHFGLTRGDRSARPALAAAARANRRTVADVEFDWPSISVVICAYNAASTLDECLRHTCALDYPNLEVIVIDDGSTDDTRAIATRHHRARLVEVPHGGLAVARNAGLRAAHGDLVAYLDSDAYPQPEWPYYLALGMDAPDVAGVGGPNIPPPGDAAGAHQVAAAPGGPAHVLFSDDRAEHIPGCNMAFWKDRLVEVGGFDPVFTAAGDDVDLCWKVLDRGWEIGFHPAAVVWHHRRPGVRRYLRQQRGYGRSEALVEARHPSRFTLAGTARWRGRIYASGAPTLARQRVYRGEYGAAAYQSVYRADSRGLDLLHQAGLPIAATVACTAPVALIAPEVGIPALVALVFIGVMAGVDAVRATPPRAAGPRRLRFRGAVAAMHVLQPLVRCWGRRQRRARTGDESAPRLALDPTGAFRERRILVVPHSGPRPELVAAVAAHIRRSGVRAMASTGWDTFDVRVIGSTIVGGELVTSAYPEGYVQVRIRRRPRGWGTTVAIAGFAFTSAIDPLAGLVFGSAAVAEITRGWWRTGPVVRRAVREATR
jgi:glycosyltransferase involved in cell wall biosynthesis